jgi:nucleotide-binding universal stress UspA family protein
LPGDNQGKRPQQKTWNTQAGQTGPTPEESMYDTILVTLDATPTDRAIIDHVKLLAKRLGSRVILLHVADGWAARRFGPDAVSEEVDQDTVYLTEVRAEFEFEGIPARSELAFGDPAVEIVKWVERNGCDLVAMSTHGHSGLADLLFGWTASKVQHEITVPVLMLKAR